MQPPPRKGNYVKFLKNLHTEQVAKLQLKNQHECDLLEDIRQFTIKRSTIEKSYSEALLKISSQYLNKKIPNIPDIKMDGMEERWNMWSVWRTVLEENEKLARARLAAIEVFQQQIADEAKMLRDYKVSIAKKALSQIVNVHKELHLSVGDLDKVKKQYFDEEHCAHDVRDKARDIEEKLKKKKGSFFQSITSLQKNSARVTSRKELLEEKSTGARNDYILSLAAANAHQNRYFTVDLQTTMTTMENYVFERVAEYLTLMGRTELLTCSATQNSFGKIRDQAQQLTREYNLQCCYLFYPVLKQHIQYEFEPCDNDPIRKVTTEHDSAAETLTKEAKNLAGRIVKENCSIRDNAKKLAVCVSLRDSGQRSDPNDPNGPDLDTKIEEFRDLIRRSETEKAKAEACLQCLREGGINVDEWVQEAEIIGAQELTRSGSSTSMRTDASGQGENPSSDSFYDSDKEDTATTGNQVASKSIEDNQMQRGTFSDSEEEIEERIPEATGSAMVQQLSSAATTGWDDPTEVSWGEDDEEEKDDIVVSEPKEAIFKCTALYSYSAQNPDELTIVENEQLEVIGEGDGDGWLRARNYRGEEGYVPHNYLYIEQDVVVNGVAGSNQLRTQISFSSVDYTVDTEDQTIDSMQSPDQVSVIMAPQKKKSDLQYCIALYDYDATAEDELTFEEGQIIKIVTKTAHGVDDGWWEGELDGKFGNFPSLVVEECDENGEPLSDDVETFSLPTGPPNISLPPAPALPPEYADDAADDDIYDTQDSIDNDEEYVTSSPIPNIPPPVLNQEPADECDNVMKIIEDKDDKDDDDDDDDDVMRTCKVTPSTLNVQNSGLMMKNKTQTLNLGMAEIVVTAATPMVEDGTHKTFPLTDVKDVNQDDHDDDDDGDGDDGDDRKAAEAPSTTVTTLTSSTKDGNIAAAAAANDRNSLGDLEKDEMQQRSGERDKERDREKKNKKKRSTPSKAKDPEANKFPDIDSNDPFQEAAKGQTIDADSNLNGATFEVNFEANFEANFEDAFASQPAATDDDSKPTEADDEEVPAPPKQVVGGRASIPEELDSNQLARLQNLKESNA